MLIVLIHYQSELDEIDRLMKAHVAFLERYFEAGIFLAAGRRGPRTGGVILVRGDDAAALERVMREDPFVTGGAATFEVVQFHTSIYHPEFAAFRDPRSRPHPR